MSNYYYNEKKGRFEPVSEAPFGIVPREKRSRKVYTPQDEVNQKEEQFSDHYSEAENLKRNPSSAGSMDNINQRLSEVINKAYGNTNSTTGSGTPVYNRQSQPYSTGNTSSNSSRQKPEQKSKSPGAVLLVVIFWIIFAISKSCSN